MAASPRRVLVLGTAFRAGPWTVRALRRAGYDVLGAEAPDPLAGRTLQTPSPLRCPDPVDDPSGLADWIVETCVTRGVRAVLSTDEDMTRVLASVVALPDGTARAGADAAGYASLCDKAALHATAARVGVRHAAAAVAGDDRSLAGVPGPPWAVKPRVSGEGAGIAVRRADTAAERDEAVRRLLDTGRGAVVESWLSGRQVVVYAVRDAGGRTHAVAARVMDRWPRAAGTPSVMVTADEPRCVAALGALLESVDHRGPANAQFIIGPDGDPFVHDVNLRIGAAVLMALRAGLDVPVGAVRAATGDALPPPRVRTGLVYVALGSEIAAARADLSRGPPAAARTLGRLAQAAVRGGVLDPPPWEPFPLAALALSGARRTARTARRARGGVGGARVAPGR